MATSPVYVGFQLRVWVSVRGSCPHPAGVTTSPPGTMFSLVNPGGPMASAGQKPFRAKPVLISS